MADQEQRKLIRFGNSSYIIAIPKSWIVKNKLKKGDTVFIEETPNNEIILTTKGGSDKESKSIKINFDPKNHKTFERELNSAYIGNYNEIKVVVKDLSQKAAAQVSKIIQDKIGLEISDQSEDQITVRDILDFEAISTEKIIRRLDNIIRSMIDDIKSSVEEGKFKEWTMKEIYNADAGINKFYFLGWKIIRKCQEDPRTLHKLKLNSRKISDIQWLILHMEYTGDELKRLAKILHTQGIHHQDALLKAMTAIEEEYLTMIKSFYNKDTAAARALSSKKKSMMELYENLFLKDKKKREGTETIVEKFKAITSFVHNISKVIGY